jgi:hypothetical protein
MTLLCHDIAIAIIDTLLMIIADIDTPLFTPLRTLMMPPLILLILISPHY